MSLSKRLEDEMNREEDSLTYGEEIPSDIFTRDTYERDKISRNEEEVLQVWKI